MYLVAFKVGGQTTAGLFDTGSFEVVLPGQRCGDDICGFKEPNMTFNTRSGTHALGSLLYDNPTLASAAHASKCYGDGCFGIRRVNDTLATMGGELTSLGKVDVAVI